MKHHKVMHRQLHAYARILCATRACLTLHSEAVLHRAGGGDVDRELFLVVCHVQHNQGNIHRGMGFATCKQFDVVSCWSKPHKAMAFRACLENSHYRLQGPTCDNEYQLAAASSNIKQSRILVEKKRQLGLLQAQGGFQTGRNRYEEDRECRIAV